MLHRTRAIALRYIPYRDTSIIAKIFTEDFGLQGFVVNGVRSARTKMSLGLFQPFSLLDLVQYHDDRKELHRLKEIKVAEPLVSIPFHPIKTSMVLFSSELLSMVVKEGQPNDRLFQLIWTWTKETDNQTEQFESRHIQLAYRLLTPLGIHPESWENLFPKALQPSGFQLEMVAPLFIQSQNQEPHQVPNHLKQWSLDMILYYMRQHLEGMGHIHSLDVLRAVFK